MNGLSTVAAYRIGSLTLDVRRHALYCDTTLLPVTTKAVQVLEVLVGRAGEVVGRDEIRREAWDEQYVEDANITKNIYVLRNLFREHFGDIEVIRTASRRGYVFVAHVTPVVEDLQGLLSPDMSGVSTSALPGGDLERTQAVDHFIQHVERDMQEHAFSKDRRLLWIAIMTGLLVLAFWCVGSLRHR